MENGKKMYVTAEEAAEMLGGATRFQFKYTKTRHYVKLNIGELFL